MNRKFLSSLLIVTAISFAGLAEASGIKHFVDPELENLMVEIGAHNDSGQSVLKYKIEEIEAEEGAFSPRLYGYLAELSRIKQANNQHLEAIDLFQRMQTLTHTLDGVHSPLQMETILLQSRSRIALGQIVKANKLEKFHLFVAKQNYQDEQLVPALWRMADWQRTTLQYRAAIRQYDETLELVHANNLSSVYEVRTLEARALAQHLAKHCCAGESLERALVSRQSSDFSDQVANQLAMLNLADMHWLYETRKPEAAALYAELGDVPAALLGPRSQSAYISALDNVTYPSRKSPTVKVYVPPKTNTVTFGEKKVVSRTASIGEPIRLCAARVENEGFVDVSMSITANGEPEDVEITGNVSSLTKRYLRAVLLESQYRPEFKDGVAVDQQLEFRQYFDRTRPLRSNQVSDWRDILAEHACQLVAMR